MTAPDSAPYMPGACLAIRLSDGDWGAALVLSARKELGAEHGDKEANLIGLLRFKASVTPEIGVFFRQEWLRFNRIPEPVPAFVWWHGVAEGRSDPRGNHVIVGYIDPAPFDTTAAGSVVSESLGHIIERLCARESAQNGDAPEEDRRTRLRNWYYPHRNDNLFVTKVMDPERLPGATLMRVLVRPEDYHGQKVSLSGIVEIRHNDWRFKGGGLYLSFEDFRFRRRENAVWFTLPESERRRDVAELREQYHGQQASVSGTVDASGRCLNAEFNAFGSGWGCALDSASSIWNTHPEESTLSREATLLRKLMVHHQQEHCRFLYEKGPLACPYCRNSDREAIRLVERPVGNSGFHLLKGDMSFFICQQCGRSFGREWPIWPAW